MADTTRKDVGEATAYAYAVAGGYVGTKEEFEEALANAAITVQELESLTAVAVTLTPGSEATASYSDGVLTLGIPAGAKGDKGDKGDTGATGAKGDTGNGISSIAKTGTSGLVDTYTITFTDGTSTTFEVTNGEDGTVTPEQMAQAIADALAAFAGESHEDMTAGLAEQLLSDVQTTDKKPYLFRKTGADATREYDTLVGGSVVGNQLVDKSTFPASDTIFTDNGDGSVTANGTPSANATYRVFEVPHDSFRQNEKYLLLSGMSATGSGSTFETMLLNFEDSNNNVYGEGTIINYSYAGSAVSYIQLVVRAGYTANNLKYKPQFFNLTKMFGSTIADHAYTLEQSTAGSGIAWLKSYGFFAGYQAYNAGSMVHVSGVSAHVMTGFNQWDEQWEVGGLYNANGTNWATSDRIRSKNYIPVIPGATYYTNTSLNACCYYDEDKTYVQGAAVGAGRFAIPSNVHYIRFATYSSYGTTYKNNICINLSSSRNGQYEPYTVNSYTLDNTLTLRGIPKLSNGEMYYDGDTYAHDGTVTRRYALVELGGLTWEKSGGGYYSNGISDAQPGAAAIGYNNIVCERYVAANVASIVALPDKECSIDSGRHIQVKDSAYSTAAALKASLSGVYLLYPLATPTTETASPYQSPQICDPDGTEEYITDGIPVGHTTDYPANLKGEIERVMVQVPKPPTSNGTYTLKCTVASSGTTYAWTT